MKIRGKSIFITAGPTWVPIDKVRVISNRATGKTGIILAKKLSRVGAKVTLLLGPVGQVKLNPKIGIKRYSFFDELEILLKKELLTKKYDVVIHSAAVSDYKLKNKFTGKIKSGIKSLRLDLGPTFKIIDRIKKYSPRVFLVMFKLELGISQSAMINNARKAMHNAKADLCVVNTFSKNKYKALIIDEDRVFCVTNSKEQLAKKLLEVISSQSD
jgi:phosphopantothenoylcysteine decarboxylase/phosphopantothenate--cysteine ligase